MKDFANQRLDYLRAHIERRFGLSGSSLLKLQRAGVGKVLLNILSLNEDTSLLLVFAALGETQLPAACHTSTKHKK